MNRHTIDEQLDEISDEELALIVKGQLEDLEVNQGVQLPENWRYRFKSLEELSTLTDLVIASLRLWA